MPCLRPLLAVLFLAASFLGFPFLGFPFLGGAGAANAAGAQPAIPSAPVATDGELEAMRGALLLPNGLEIAVVVRVETSLNGQLLLRTLYRVDQDAPELKVFAPLPGQTAAGLSARPAAAASGGEEGVFFTFDRGTGLTMVRTGQPAAGQVSVEPGAAAEMIDFDSAPALDLMPGQSIETAGGEVSLGELPAGRRVVLAGDQLDVNHLVGQAYGTVVANSGNNRVIDTATVISIDLKNAAPDLVGSTMFQVDALALDAATQLGR